jgi:ribosomal protein L7/L12
VPRGRPGGERAGQVLPSRAGAQGRAAQCRADATDLRLDRDFASRLAGLTRLYHADMSPEEYARLARLELQINYLFAHLGLDPAAATGGAGAGYDAMPAPGPVPGPPVGAAVPPELISALQRGRTIEAIKIYRSITGLGLAEAKAAVEDMARQYR